jgi:uncharacterized protein YybS (DUF2232 family)
MPFRPIIIPAFQTTGLVIAGLLVPVLGQIAVVFAPVPLVIASVLHGRKSGVLASCVAAALVAAVGAGQTAVLLLFLSIMLMALGLAEGMLRNVRHEITVLLGGFLPILFLLIFLAPLLATTGKNPITLAEEHLRQNLLEAQQLYTRMGLGETAQSIASLSDSMVFYLVRLIPGIILATTLIQSAGCYGMARSLVLRRNPGSHLAAHPFFSAWRAPDQWVWGLIATLGLVAAFPRGSAAWFTGLNVAILFLLVYLVQGIAIVEFYLRKARISVIWRSLLHTLILTLPTVVAVIACGVVDIWGDFRKIRTTVSRL